MSIINFFDKLEDKIRACLSRRPIIYSLIAGFAIVLFWRGVWHFADLFWFMNGPLGLTVSLLVTIVVMLLTGLFTSFFVGDVIIMSGLKKEKKLIEKTESEIREEDVDLYGLKKELEEIKKMVADLKNDVSLIKPSRKKKVESILAE
jgi:uncharacterized protein YneF (UPF0154 family)